MRDDPRFFQNLDFTTIKTVIFDCDDTLYPSNPKSYPRGTEKGLHQRIKENIRAVVDHDPEMLAAMGIAKFDMPHIGETFHGIVKHYQQKGPEILDAVLDRFYAVTYDFPPEPTLVSDLHQMKEQGIALGIDTNGTAFNVRKVLARHGVPDDVFGNRINDILISDHGKGTPERAQDVVAFFDIQSPEQALYVDDNLNVIKAMKQAGFNTILIDDHAKKIPEDMRPFIDAVYPSAALLTEHIISARLAAQYRPPAPDLSPRPNL